MAFGQQPNFLAQALQRQRLLRNPFAPIAPVGNGLTPNPMLPAQFAHQFDNLGRIDLGLTPMGKAPASPQAMPQGAPPASVGFGPPPQGTPPSAPPGQGTPGTPGGYDPNAAFQQAQTALANFQPYQETPIQLQQTPYSTNPKGDAITSGIEMLGAALMPQYGAAIGKTVEAQGQQREQDYQRRTKEAQTQYEAQSTEQERLGRNSIAEQAILERRLDAAQRGVEAQETLKQRAETEEARNAIRRQHETAYAQNVINRHLEAKDKLTDDRWYHAQQIGVRNKAVAASIWKQKDADANRLTIAGMRDDTALALVNRKADIETALAYTKEQLVNVRDTRKYAFLAAQNALNRLNADYMNVIKMGSNPLAGPQAQAAAAQLMEPGGAYDQVVEQMKALGSNMSPSTEVTGIAEAGAQGYNSSVLGIPETAGVSGGGYGAAQAPVQVNVNLPQGGGMPSSGFGGLGGPNMIPPAGSVGAVSFPEPFTPFVQQASQQFNVPADLVQRVVMAESSGNPNATSPKGAMGLMQLMPGTASSLGVKNPYDPQQNIMGGAQYLGQMLQRYQGNQVLALIAYNAGPGIADRVAQGDNSVLSPETMAYVPKILGSQIQMSPAKPTQPAKPQGPEASQQVQHVANLAIQVYDTQHKGEPFDAAWGAMSQSMRQMGASQADMQAAETALRKHIEKASAQNTQGQESRAVAAETAELQRENPAFSPQQAAKVALRESQQANQPYVEEPRKVALGILRDGKPGGVQRAIAELAKPPYKMNPIAARSMVAGMQSMLSAAPIPYQSGF